MSENKTQPTDASVEKFLNGVEDEGKRADCLTLLALMSEVTGEPAVMWGDSIVGFGQYHYKTVSGRSGDWLLTGFSPRKANLTVYIMAGFDAYDDLLKKVGKYKTGKSCLYLKSLKDVDMAALREMVRQSVEHMRATNPG